MNNLIDMQEYARQTLGMPKMVRISNKRNEPLFPLHTELTNQLSRLDDYIWKQDEPSGLLVDIRDKMGKVAEKIQELTYRSR